MLDCSLPVLSWLNGGGGARIVDKYSKKIEKTLPEIGAKKKQRAGAVPFQCMHKINILYSIYYCFSLFEGYTLEQSHEGRL